ncbi:iron complex transport system permease protein [Azorhizobium sp. AG788]|uniref:Fe(3+)-hydroxamate ABC transporter permease FhuB n=1 Tax=Azorhizobium sp. AG788 TaxID=2183897 RepID=UPI00106158BB|nr:Fe(3+)-hydroxamate ABC transporter permease FhuB [Azorhizobium sp. AG788]TDT94635.1 iron complex transport system permease protein [Azorhizobium sp. AG788]
MADVARLPRPLPRAPLAVAGLALLALVLCVMGLLRQPTLPGDPATAQALKQVVLWHSLLPRAVVPLLAGAALGLSGALLQRVLRNPIADPSTLGIASGAQLALTASALLIPALAEWPREVVALMGGVTAVGLVLMLGWKRGLEPITVVLSGMTLSLICAALSSALVLARGEYVLSLFVWGAGSLHQQSWAPALGLAWRFAIGLVAAVLLLRPLSVLTLDDSSARSLGMAVNGARLAIIALAVWLAASVVALVGVIGFVGLAAPAFARISGARTPRAQLLLAPLLGALLLWLTDGLVQVAGADALPTGAATGLIGGPLLLWLLPRLKHVQRPQAATPVGRRLAYPLRGLLLLAAGLALLILAALLVGRSYGGWQFATGALFEALAPFRVPRVAAAAAAGALLGAAGTLMQRLTGNPLAGPEVLGVSAGAGVGLSVVLLLLPAPTVAVMMGGSAAGALVALLGILAFALATGFGPERLLLGGIALGAASLAFISAVLASGDARAFLLLGWMAGTTDRVGSVEAGAAAGIVLLLVPPLLLASRWLDILPLGSTMARALGVPLLASRLLLALAAALMTACAAFIVGPLSLVGLIGPHLARLSGFARGAHQMLAAALIGAGLMVLADWLGRTLAFPYQIPVGLFAALVGGPYLIWLLRRGPGTGA